MSFANPTYKDVIAISPFLQWRKCTICGHIGLHADNMVPWQNCRKCNSQHTILMLNETKLLHERNNDVHNS